jgi:[ribosomal protein S5]-alanine N-acetyltransferase
VTEFAYVTITRLISRADAAELADVLTANREFHAPWDPLRSASYFTVESQRAGISDALQRHAEGLTLPHVIVDQGRIVGRITLNGIVRGPFLSCSVGYWLDQAATGRGLATAALQEISGIAFGELGLHRIQAETLLHNVASQRVLERNGFTRIGLAPAYLCIQGRWQDMIIFQLVNPAMS